MLLYYYIIILSNSPSGQPRHRARGVGRHGQLRKLSKLSDKQPKEDAKCCRKTYPTGVWIHSVMCLLACFQEMVFECKVLHKNIPQSSVSLCAFKAFWGVFGGPLGGLWGLLVALGAILAHLGPKRQDNTKKHRLLEPPPLHLGAILGPKLGLC